MTEAEFGVIGCVLIDNDVLNSIWRTLKPEMFSSDFAQDTYKEMLAMYDRNESIDPMSLSMALENHKYTQEQISELMKSCITGTITSTMVKSYADAVAKEYKSRTVRDMYQKSSLKPCDIDDTISDLLTRLEHLQEGKEVKLKPIKQISVENKDKYFNESVGEGGIKIGLSQLDDALGDLERGDVTVIAARPAVGKSALTTQIIGNMAKRGLKVAYFNLEMSDKQVYERFISRLAEIGLTRIRRAKAFLGDEQEKFNQANEEMSDYQLWIASGTVSPREIKSECRHQNFDVIVVDYLQLLMPDNRYSGRNEEVASISRGLKSVARDLNTHVIALSQITRASESRDTKEPTMAELRESGAIEQDASNIIMLWNLSDNDKGAKGVKIEKNRQGMTMREAMEFDGDHMKFVEIEKPFDDVVAEIKKKERGDGFKPYNGDCPF